MVDKTPPSRIQVLKHVLQRLGYQDAYGQIFEHQGLLMRYIIRYKNRGQQGCVLKIHR